MLEKNYDFPYIKYDPSKTYREWGLAHGESFREGIKELLQIRKELIVKPFQTFKVPNMPIITYPVYKEDDNYFF